jgi:C1A family cysteine protease
MARKNDPVSKLRQQMIAGFGWKRDLPDPRDYSYSAAPKILRALPPSVDLREHCPPVYDQGRIGSCTANAIAGAIQFDRIKNGQEPDFVPSRLFIYWNERYIEGDVPDDKGAQLRDGIKSVNTLGVCPEPEWPYDDSPAPYDGGPFPKSSRAAKKPTPACYRDAKKYRALSYQRLDQDVAQLKGCLAEGLPFVFGFMVFDSFFKGPGKQQVNVPVPSAKDKPLGGHAVLCVGYHERRRVFICRNSWGEKQGLKGYFHMPYDYLADGQLSADFWVIRGVSG